MSSSLEPHQSPNTLFKEDIGFLEDIFKNQLPLPWDEISESWALPNSQKPGYSPVYMNKYCVNNNNSTPYSTFHPSLQTLGQLQSIAFKIYADQDCLGKRLYNKKTKKFDDFFTFESFLKTAERRKLLGAGFFKILKQNKFLGPEIDTEDFILTLYSANRQEWALCDMACQYYKLCNTSLYDSLGPETSSYILNLTESPMVVCSKDKLDVLLRIKKESDIRTLVTVVSMDDLDPEDQHYYSLFEEAGIELFDFRTVEEIGIENPKAYKPGTPDDLYTISFTSGTTGLPKGVLITQRVAMAGVLFASSTIRDTKSLNMSSGRSQPYALCFLPLAHIYERQGFLNELIKGIGIGFPHTGAPSALLENLLILKPDYLGCVPRVFSKLEAAIKDKLDTPGYLLAFARGVIEKKMKLQSSKDGETGRLYLRDQIVSKKLRKALGFENVLFVVSGSAPISPETLKYFKLALNCGFGQGYGMTESFAGICFSDIFELNPGSCGPLGITGELRLKDIPEMNYDSKDLDNPKGELLLRGPQVFDYYYKNPELTKSSFDEDGWFHTGDVATFDKSGKLYIIDRVKNFFKLAQGEYITPERIENVYLSSCPTLSQLYIHGDSFKSYLVAIAGVDVARIRKLIEREDRRSTLLKLQDEDLLRAFNKNRSLKVALLKELQDGVKNQGLQGYEKFHNIYVDVEPLKLEDGVITPTIKIKRNVAKKHFEKIIDELYEEGSLIKNSKL